MVELEQIQKREQAEQKIKPAALPARPRAESGEDILEQFKRESTAITGTKPSQAQIDKHLDDYARQAIIRAASAKDGKEWNQLLESFSDNALKVIHKSDPVLALQIAKTRDAAKAYAVEADKVIEKHGSIHQAAKTEYQQKSIGYRVLNPSGQQLPESLERLRKAIRNQLGELQRVATAPSTD